MNTGKYVSTIISSKYLEDIIINTWQIRLERGRQGGREGRKGRLRNWFRQHPKIDCFWEVGIIKERISKKYGKTGIWRFSVMRPGQGPQMWEEMAKVVRPRFVRLSQACFCLRIFFWKGNMSLGLVGMFWEVVTFIYQASFESILAVLTITVTFTIDAVWVLITVPWSYRWYSKYCAGQKGIPAKIFASYLDQTNVGPPWTSEKFQTNLGPACSSENV